MTKPTTPGELANSRRQYEKVTYTPVRTRRDSGSDADTTMSLTSSTSGTGGNDRPASALTTAAMVRTLRLTSAEVAQLREQAPDDDQREALDAMESLAGAPSGPQALEASRKLARVPATALAAVARSLGELRSAAVEQYDRILAEPDEAPVVDDEPAYVGMARVESRREPDEPDRSAAPAIRDGVADEPPPYSRIVRAAAQPEQRELASTRAGMPAERLSRLRELALPHLADVPADPLMVKAHLARLRDAPMVFADALTRRPLEPVGLLHLERLVMTPLEVERGELVYSLPLAPREKVTLAHREWTTRQEEFQRYVQDYLENFSERGVAEADDIAMSSSTQTRHANELSMGSMPTSTSAATLTAAVDVGNNTSIVESQASRQESERHSRTVTSRASSRSIRDQKMSFTVTTVSGVEDFTARLLENPHTDKAMRIDYFRRMRRWRTDLYRYDVRMTYDVVLPDPGRRLRGRQTALAEVERDLAEPFTIDLKPSNITPDTWAYYADYYGVAAPPPPEKKRIEVARPVGHHPPINTINAEGANWKKTHFFEQIDIAIPDGYRLSALHVDVEASTWTSGGVGPQWISVLGGGFRQSFDAGNSGYLLGSIDMPITQLPTTGTVSVGFKLKGILAGQLAVLATVAPADATMQAWRQQVWRAIRDKAYADFLAERDRLRERRAAITREIDQTDAVTLRRLEREQIMLLVLEWLFPGFDTATDVLSPGQVPGALTPDAWLKITEYGEYIKFIQTAIDWDNVLVLLYPYFWDVPANNEEKLLLDHPDPLHREFLRAGAARVVLAVQPGFEAAVVSLLDQGQIGNLDNDSDFARIAAEVQKAHAAYQKSAPNTSGSGNTDRVALVKATGDTTGTEMGVLIGSWHDYTPTPALDLDVITLPVRVEG